MLTSVLIQQQQFSASLSASTGTQSSITCNWQWFSCLNFRLCQSWLSQITLIQFREEEGPGTSPNKSYKWGSHAVGEWHVHVGDACAVTENGPWFVPFVSIHKDYASVSFPLQSIFTLYNAKRKDLAGLFSPFSLPSFHHMAGLRKSEEQGNVLWLQLWAALSRQTERILSNASEVWLFCQASGFINIHSFLYTEF